MTGAELLIKALKKESVSLMFGYPGGTVIPIFDVLHRTRGIELLLTRHEQAAVHAADGYARASGKVGVCLVTSGPGTTNTVTGIATAKTDSIPMVVLSGQVKTSVMGSDAFQEVDTIGLMMPVCKHNYLIRDVSEIPAVVEEAFHIARSGRPGPVSIDLPMDISMQEADANKPAPVFQAGKYRFRTRGNPRQIEKLADSIQKAKRPLLYTGGGIIHAGASGRLREFLEKTNIPVVVTLMGLGSVPADHRLFLGMPGMHGTPAANYALTECDLLIALGVRFDDRVTCNDSGFAARAVIAHVDIDPLEIGKNIKADIQIVGDAGNVLESLLAEVPGRSPDAWNSRTEEWKAAFCMTPQQPENGEIYPQHVVGRIGALMDPHGIIVTDVGQHQIWAALHFPHKRPRSFISSGGLGTMGFGLPAAMGAALAHPGKDVVLLSGDGSIQMNIQELATCSVNRIPVKIFVLNNSYLGMVRQWQELFWNRQYAKTCLRQTPWCPRECNGPGRDCPETYNPDLVGIAEACGVKACRVSEPADLDRALKEALDAEGTSLVEVMVKKTENVFPMVPLGKSLKDVISGG